jgi:hypothetical protein
MFYPTKQKTKLTLSDLARIHHLDKGDYDVSLAKWHGGFPLHDTLGYTRTYDKVFGPHKDEKFNFLEIGCADPRFPFGSCSMWREFFTNADVFAMDIQQVAGFVNELGVNFFHGDQSSEEFLAEIRREVPSGFRFIIDDGSHLPKDILASFNGLWPILEKGGVYFIEDVGIGLEMFSHENAAVLEWAKTHPQTVGGEVELIRADTKRYDVYLIQIRKLRDIDVGMQVRVTKGIFASACGRVMSVKNGGVLVQFGHGGAVEFPIGNIEIFPKE